MMIIFPRNGRLRMILSLVCLCAITLTTYAKLPRPGTRVWTVCEGKDIWKKEWKFGDTEFKKEIIQDIKYGREAIVVQTHHHFSSKNGCVELVKVQYTDDYKLGCLRPHMISDVDPNSIPMPNGFQKDQLCYSLQDNRKVSYGAKGTIKGMYEDGKFVVKYDKLQMSEIMHVEDVHTSQPNDASITLPGDYKVGDKVYNLEHTEGREGMKGIEYMAILTVKGRGPKNKVMLEYDTEHYMIGLETRSVSKSDPVEKANNILPANYQVGDEVYMLFEDNDAKRTEALKPDSDDEETKLSGWPEMVYAKKAKIVGLASILKVESETHQRVMVKLEDKMFSIYLDWLSTEDPTRKGQRLPGGYRVGDVVYNKKTSDPSDIFKKRLKHGKGVVVGAGPKVLGDDMLMIQFGEYKHVIDPEDISKKPAQLLKGFKIGDEVYSTVTVNNEKVEYGRKGVVLGLGTLNIDNEETLLVKFDWSNRRNLMHPNNMMSTHPDESSIPGGFIKGDRIYLLYGISSVRHHCDVPYKSQGIVLGRAAVDNCISVYFKKSSITLRAYPHELQKFELRLTYPNEPEFEDTYELADLKENDVVYVRNVKTTQRRFNVDGIHLGMKGTVTSVGKEGLCSVQFATGEKEVLICLLTRDWNHIVLDYLRRRSLIIGICLVSSFSLCLYCCCSKSAEDEDLDQDVEMQAAPNDADENDPEEEDNVDDVSSGSQDNDHSSSDGSVQNGVDNNPPGVADQSDEEREVDDEQANDANEAEQEC